MMAIMTDFKNGLLILSLSAVHLYLLNEKKSNGFLNETYSQLISHNPGVEDTVFRSPRTYDLRPPHFVNYVFAQMFKL